MEQAAPRTIGLRHLVGSGILIGVTLPLSGGCGTTSQQPDPPPEDEHAYRSIEVEPAPEQPEGHRRMIETLKQIDQQARVDNPFLGQSIAPTIRADLAAHPADGSLAKRWLLNVLLGSQELRLGNEQASLDHYREAYRLLGASREPVPREHVIRTFFELGVAYMRWAETQNCVNYHNAESCLFPIRGGGVHRLKEGAGKAAEMFLEALKLAQPGSPEYFRARWLLNVAYMTLGQYPDGVPREFLIPPGLFASDESFPRFREIAVPLGLDSFDLAGGALAEDFTGDGLLDVMVSSMDTAGQMRFYVNDGDGGFTERTQSAGLLGLLGGLNMTHTDYDNDGDTDVLVLRGAWWRQLGRHPNSLLRNNGDGTFSDVTFEAGLGDVHYPTQTADWGDYDNDGDLDVFIGNESGKAIRFDTAPAGDATSPCQLFRNNGDGTFSDVAAEAGVENMRYTKSVAWGDYDDDRFLDLYVSNGGYKNRLYHNNGDGSFTDVAEQAGVTLPIASFPAWWWDVNNDGALDLLVNAYGGGQTPPDVGDVAASYLGMQPRGELTRLYLGDGKGGFRNVAAEWNLFRVTLPMGANNGDLDNDGYPDFYLGTGYPYYRALMPNFMYHNLRGRGFADVTADGGFGHLQKGHGIFLADLDNDGDQDVFEQIGGAYPGDKAHNVLFENPGFGNHWIKLRLVGVRSNRPGIGTWIRIDVVEDSRPRSIFRRADTGGSFGANPMRQEIGVGRAEKIELLELYWPASDTTQRFRDVPVDRALEIIEGEQTYREFSLPELFFDR